MYVGKSNALHISMAEAPIVTSPWPVLCTMALHQLIRPWAITSAALSRCCSLCTCMCLGVISPGILFGLVGNMNTEFQNSWAMMQESNVYRDMRKP